MNILSLEGKAVLITGAGAGVGRAAAHHMAAHGAKGVVVNDFSAERANKVADEINATYGAGKALAIAADVTDFDAVMAMAEQGTAQFGALDVLVNNAGNAGADPTDVNFAPFWQQAPKNWQPWLGVNLMGVLNCTRALVPNMIKNERGSLITVISDAGRVGEAGLEVYSAAKAGAAGFMRAMARSLGRYNIRANNVAISAVATQATARLRRNEEAAKKALSKYVIRRFGEPEDIANMILFLASDASSWVTGQTYPVNGGFAFNQ